MKHIFVRRSVITGLLAATLMLPAGVSAYWPFSYGQVKGATTEGGFFGIMQRAIMRFSGKPNTDSINYGLPSGASGAEGEGRFAPLGASGAMGITSPKERLDAAVKNGKLTQAQEDEILARLLAIRTKQQELMTLETSLKDWMKTNNLTTEMFGPPPRAIPGAAGSVNGRMPLKYNPSRPSGYPTGGQTEPPNE